MQCGLHRVQPTLPSAGASKNKLRAFTAYFLGFDRLAACDLRTIGCNPRAGAKMRTELM
jgi:hypothetical protein